MEPSRVRLLTLVSAAALTAWGVSLSGPAENPWNLFLVWCVPVGILHVWTSCRPNLALGIAVVVVLAASGVGLVQTLGVAQTLSIGGAMVCLGLVAGVMAAAQLGPFADHEAAP